jgi:hypothetical protein
MATLFPQVERLRVSRDRLVRLRPKVEQSPPPPTEPPRSREWVARETLAHIVEMLLYWQGEIERIVGGEREPVPFGRGPDDLIRQLTVDRDRTMPVGEMYVRLDRYIEWIVRRLLQLDDRQCARRGLHKTRGDMTVRQVVDEMLVAHLEAHCDQLAASLEAVAAAPPVDAPAG